MPVESRVECRKPQLAKKITNSSPKILSIQKLPLPLQRKKQIACLSQQLHGAIAQLVEQRTENPCVPGSIPGGTTEQNDSILSGRFLLR